MSIGKQSFKFKLDTRTIVILGLLTAIQVVLSRFLSFSVWNMRIGFGFVPIVMAAMMFGPIPAAIVAGLSDVLGATLFPVGAFFPGFTLTAVLVGIIFGLFLREKQSMGRIVAAVGLTQLICSLLINTYWISLLYGAPYITLIPPRLIQTAILVPVEVVVILVLAKAVKRIPLQRTLA